MVSIFLPIKILTTFKSFAFSTAGQEIVGTLLVEFSSLPLEDLNLSYNSLTGSIPEVYSDFDGLKTLLVQGNNLEGVMPEDICSLSSVTALEADCVEEIICDCCTQCY